MATHHEQGMVKWNQLGSEKIMDPKAILAKMTLVEKIRLCSGKDAWQTEDFPHLGISSIRFSDGPHGVRKTNGKEDHLGLFDSEKAVAFPTASLSACSWDTDLLYDQIWICRIKIKIGTTTY